MKILLYLYYRFPQFLRIIAVSLYGFYLRKLRYGRETEGLVKEALARELWSQQESDVWERERLAYVLKRAATKVPYYREYWGNQRRIGNKHSDEILENWPVLKKEFVRKNTRSFLAEDCDLRKMFCEHTGGTTGTPLVCWWNKFTIRSYYSLLESRVRVWNGVSLKDRWGSLFGKIVTPLKQNHPPFWVWNQGLNQLYFSSYHLTFDFVKFYIEAIQRYDLKYLYGYPSSIYALAQAAKERKLSGPKLKVVITTGETLYQYQREAISEVFKCPVRNAYGLAEITCAASECNFGSLHIWPEAGKIEILKDDSNEQAPNGQEGRIISTGLLNDDMLLIRYETGDRGTLMPAGSICGCGRNLPILQSISGRSDDFIFIKNGGRIGLAFLSIIFQSDFHIKEAQVIQENLDSIQVRFVPSAGFTSREELEIKKRVRERIGDVSVLFEAVDSIPRLANGKFNPVINNLKV